MNKYTFTLIILISIYLIITLSLIWVGVNEAYSRIRYYNEIQNVKQTGWDRAIPICTSFYINPVIRVQKRGMKYWEPKPMSKRQIEIFCRKEGNKFVNRYD